MCIGRALVFLLEIPPRVLRAWTDPADVHEIALYSVYADERRVSVRKKNTRDFSVHSRRDCS